MKYMYKTILMCMTAFVFVSCDKFLSEKSDQALAVPVTLRDFQALLDDFNNTLIKEPSEGAISSDEYFITDNDWAALSSEESRLLYIWEKHNATFERDQSWASFGTVVNYANTVIKGINDMSLQDRAAQEARNILGQAYFLRGKMLFQSAVIWCLSYDDRTADVDLGLPLRTDTDFNKLSIRSSLRETYDQIIDDLSLAAILLNQQPLQKTRSSKPAAYAMLARVFLAMRNYDEAKQFADSSLMYSSTLIDYNTLNASANFPFTLFNDEVIMDTAIPLTAVINPSRARVDTSLYNLYEDDDLRKRIFFRKVNNDYAFKGGYRGSNSIFGGLSVDEMYLIQAECLVRDNKEDAALQVLNEFLSTRYLKETFSPIQPMGLELLLERVIEERRKQLINRGARWIDVKRLNKEGWEIEMQRELNGITYSIPPNSRRYALPIPQDVIDLTGMQQNTY